MDSAGFQGKTVDARAAGRAFGRWILFLKLVKCVSDLACCACVCVCVCACVEHVCVCLLFLLHNLPAVPEVKKCVKEGETVYVFCMCVLVFMYVCMHTQWLSLRNI